MLCDPDGSEGPRCSAVSCNSSAAAQAEVAANYDTCSRILLIKFTQAVAWPLAVPDTELLNLVTRFSSILVVTTGILKYILKHTTVYP